MNVKRATQRQGAACLTIGLTGHPPRFVTIRREKQVTEKGQGSASDARV